MIEKVTAPCIRCSDGKIFGINEENLALSHEHYLSCLRATERIKDELFKGNRSCAWDSDEIAEILLANLKEVIEILKEVGE